MRRSVERASATKKVSSAASRRREATTGPLPKVKSASGPRGTGSQTNRSSFPPVRHHGPGATNADVEGARNTVASTGSPAPPRREGFERGSPKRPRSPGSANHCAARRYGPQVSATVWRRSRGCFTTLAETRFVSSFAETRFRAPWRCSRGRAITSGSRTESTRPIERSATSSC
jgi:hypothetical protein